MVQDIKLQIKHRIVDFIKFIILNKWLFLLLKSVKADVKILPIILLNA